MSQQNTNDMMYYAVQYLDSRQLPDVLGTFLTGVALFSGEVSARVPCAFLLLCLRPRLVSMCKYMGLQTFGTDAYLRYILRARLAW